MNARFATALATNRSRDFWSEAKNSSVVIIILVVSVMDSQRRLTLVNCLRENQQCATFYFSHCDPFVKLNLVHYSIIVAISTGVCSGAYPNQMLKIYVQHDAKG